MLVTKLHSRMHEAAVALTCRPESRAAHPAPAMSCLAALFSCCLPSSASSPSGPVLVPSVLGNDADALLNHRDLVGLLWNGSNEQKVRGTMQMGMRPTSSTAMQRPMPTLPPCMHATCPRPGPHSA